MRRPWALQLDFDPARRSAARSLARCSRHRPARRAQYGRTRRCPVACSARAPCRRMKAMAMRRKKQSSRSASSRASAPSDFLTAPFSCPSRCSGSLRLRTPFTENAAAQQDHRASGPDHSRSQCQRLCAVGRRRPAFAAAGRISPPRHAREAGRRARLCHAAYAGDRCFRHAPAPGRTRPADRHRRAAVARYETACAERRGVPRPARRHATRTARPARTPRGARQVAPRTRSADRARSPA